MPAFKIIRITGAASGIANATARYFINRCWQVAHGNRELWRVGVNARALDIVVRLLGSGVRGIYKNCPAIE